MISTMKIDILKTNPDRSGRHFIQFDNGKTVRLYRQTIEDFGLFPGMDLDEDSFQRLIDAAGSMSAKMRAVRIISATNVSKRDLQNRLVQKGESPTQAKDAVEWLEDLHLVDDSRAAEQIVHSCITKGYGLARTKQVLYEKRIPKSYWDEALAEYPDQKDYIFSFLSSRLAGSSDEKTVKKAIDALIRKGHKYSTIREVLRTLPVDCDDYSED